MEGIRRMERVNVQSGNEEIGEGKRSIERK